MALIELHRTFSRNPLAVFLHVIEHARKPVTFEEIKSGLVHGGLPEYFVTSQWARFERVIKDDAHIYFMPETRTYAWGPAVELPDATQAVQLLASGKAQINPDRKVLGEIILAALDQQPATQPKPQPHPHFPPASTPREDQESQRIFEERLRADSARAYAKVAMELEELIAGGASARVLLQRIHAGAQAHGLRPIESAGATIRFDRLRHDPVLGSTQEGSEVLVVRPGYVWQVGDEEVLVAKAVVIEQ